MRKSATESRATAAPSPRWAWTPGLACATRRTPWGTLPRALPAATTAAAATWTTPPATCSPGT